MKLPLIKSYLCDWAETLGKSPLSYQIFGLAFSRRKEKYLRDLHFIYNISVNDSGALRSQMEDWLKSEFSASLTLYNREARLIMSGLPARRHQNLYAFSRRGFFIGKTFIVLKRQSRNRCHSL